MSLNFSVLTLTLFETAIDLFRSQCVSIILCIIIIIMRYYNIYVGFRRMVSADIFHIYDRLKLYSQPVNSSDCAYRIAIIPIVYFYNMSHVSYNNIANLKFQIAAHVFKYGKGIYEYTMIVNAHPSLSVVVVDCRYILFYFFLFFFHTILIIENFLSTHSIEFLCDF